MTVCHVFLRYRSQNLYELGLHCQLLLFIHMATIIMRNPRRITLDQVFISQNNVLTDAPPQDSLFWFLWHKCQVIATKALSTDFIQGINHGTLDPIKYGAFTVSDAYYCFNGAQDYLAAESKAEDPTLQQYLLKKYQSYQKYNDEFPTIWHIRDASGVVPIDVCKAYSDFERQVASHQASIYTLITMIPCEFLWYWLAHSIAPANANNLYKPWINYNDDPSGAYAIGNFINEYQKTHPEEINVDTAFQLYSTAMNYETENFIAATL